MRSPLTVAKGHFEAFGTVAANKLISEVERLPPDIGLEVMRGAMNRASPTAFDRAQAYAHDAQVAGTDPETALRLGVARAMSESLLTELHDIGSQHLAKQNGLSGLGKPIVGGVTHVGTNTGQTSQVQVASSMPMIKVGPWLFPKSTDEEIVQLQGNCPAPRWIHNGHPVGYSKNENYSAIPGTIKKPSIIGIITQGVTTKPTPDDWQAIIVDTLSHDCNFPADCITSSMTDATPGHRYGALRDFVPNLTSQINKDFVGLASADGVGGSDSNKEPDNPIIATSHPITGETWGVYMYLAVPHGGMSWGCPDNPVSLLLKFKKVADCGDFITPQNIATVAALTFVTGGTYGLLTGLGIISSCYIWQFIKAVVAVIVEIAEAIAGAVAGLACALASIPNLGTAVAQTGVQTKNTAATAVGVGIALAGALCAPSCPPGQIAVGSGCGCPSGQTLTNGICVATPWWKSPIVLIGLAVVGVFGFSILSDDKPKTARSAA
jgi:hypothetical protein